MGGWNVFSELYLQVTLLVIIVVLAALVALMIWVKHREYQRLWQWRRSLRRGHSVMVSDVGECQVWVNHHDGRLTVCPWGSVMRRYLSVRADKVYPVPEKEVEWDVV